MRSIALLLGFLPVLNGSASEKIAFAQKPGAIEISIAGRPFATYCYQDAKISRPYFAHVHAPNGIQVTRNHPPRKDDFRDHATFHPGLFLAFGDVSGNDYWRLRASVKFHSFLQKPWSKDNHAGFSVRHHYLKAGSDEPVCVETFRCQIVVIDAGYLLLWDSTFEPVGTSVTFGDQEEMGLGVRVATPIAVKKDQGGRMLDSQGRRNEKQIWGKQSKWCDYSGKVNGKKVGITLMPHPDNFRSSWFHARDYGVLVANPFGRNAFTRKEKSRIVVTRDKPLRLRFGALFHGPEPATAKALEQAYHDYLKLSQSASN